MLLGLSKILSDQVVLLLLPAIRAELNLLDGNLAISRLYLRQEGGRDEVVLDANLAYPLYVGERVIEPLDWKSGSRGYFETTLSARGVLLSPLVLLIVVLGWPARRPHEMGLRLLLALPLLALIVALDAPLDLLGTFQHAVLHQAGLEITLPLFTWAQFLEGAGGIAIAVAFAVSAVSAAMALDRSLACDRISAGGPVRDLPHPRCRRDG